jgi:hypothetical protein
VISVHLAVVPPMSKPIARSMPRRSANRPAPIMPATGPDSIIATGSRRACAIDMVPPFERMIAILPAKRASRAKPSKRPR